MKKIFYTILVVFFFFSGVQFTIAQNGKPSVGVLQLDAADLPSFKAVKINKYIESAFYKSNRFDIVTRQLRAAIDQERSLQKENIDNIAIQQGKAIGADYIVRGRAKAYKQVIQKSSPKSRAPRRSTRSSTSSTSPRRSSTDTKKTDTQTKKSSTSDSSNKTTLIRRTKTKTSTKDKTSSNSNTSKVFSTSPKNANPAKVRKVPKTSDPKTSNTSPVRKTSPKKEEEKKTTSTPRPLSSEIDRIYTNTQINFTIEIIDVKTGVVVKEKSYNGSINRVQNFVQNFLRETFPFELQILEILEMKGKKKAKNLLVYGGEKHGVRPSTYLDVYEISEENVDGKILTREVKVGRLFVMKLDTGGNFSLCRIFKGKKVILEKIKQGTKLVCR